MDQLRKPSGEGEGTEHTSRISVRRWLVAVVGERWLPALVTPRTVDPAEKKSERVTTRLGGVPFAPFLRTVSVGVAGVSPRLETTFGQPTRSGGG